MLIRLTKVSIGGKGASGGVILNTDYLSELVVLGTGAQFQYYEQPEDRRRARKCEWVVEETVAVIRAAMNTPYHDNIVSLDIFPHNDITKVTYRTHYQIREIVKIYPYATNHDYSWILMNLKGVKLERLLVDNYWLDFVSLAETGSTSTTTSSTSSTSSSSTSTTSTYTTTSYTSSTTTLP